MNVHHGPADVPTRLSQLGVTEKILLDAVLYGQQFGFDWTDNDVPSARGIVVWDKTMRALRDQLLSFGWTRSNDHNYATVVHPDGTHAIAAAGGDPRTGKADETPATRSEKGPATRHAIAQNQLNFAVWDKTGEWAELEQSRAPVRTWILLYHYDEEAQEIRAELSLPAEMTLDGQVVDWRERIILGALDLGGQPLGASLPTPPPTGPVDVPVRRRAV